MYLVDDYGEPYVALFSVQYTPKYSDYPCRPHDACFKLKRDPKGREGVFIQPSRVTASLLWPTSRMRWRPPLHSDGRSFRPTVM